MEKKTKRILSALLCFVMLMALLPTAVFATEATEAYAGAVSANVDSYATPVTSTDGKTVTFTASGTIVWANGGGTYGNWMGFKLTAPTGIDAANVTILRPDGQIRILSNIQDGTDGNGNVYANLYRNVATEVAAGNSSATYKVDWEGDGVYDLDIVLDFSGATLAPDPNAPEPEPTTEATEPSSEETEPSSEATEPVEFALTYNVYSESAYVSGYVGTVPETLIIPDTYQDLPVLGIADSAFYDCQTLVNLQIPEGVSSIGNTAFSWCTNLAQVDLPNSMGDLGNGAFSWCPNLTHINLPEGLYLLGADVFGDSGLTSIFFKGSSTQWEALLAESDNEGLENVNVAFGLIDNLVPEESTAPTETTSGDYITTIINNYIEMEVVVPEGATGNIEYYLNAFQIPNNVEFALGDKLEYNVRVDAQVGGIGGITLINGGLNLHDSGALDANGVSVHTSADISNYAYGEWYTRSITLPSNMLLDFDALAIPFAFDVLPGINTPAAPLAGQTITICYDNIKLVDAEGNTKYVIYNEGQDPGNAPLVDTTVATVTTSIQSEELQLFPIEPTDPQPTTEGTEPTGDATEPSSEATEPQPTTEATEPTLDPTDPHNEYVELTVKFPQDTSTLVGTGEFYPIAFWLPNTVVFETGDYLVYDVWMSRNAGGFGAVDLCSGSTYLRDTQFDQNGISAHPYHGDVSTRCALQWYTREIPLTDAFATTDWSQFGAGPAVLFPIHLPYNPSLIAGETITIKYDNIKIMKADGTVRYTVFTDNEPIVPYGEQWLVPFLNGWADVDYNYEVVDLTPDKNGLFKEGDSWYYYENDEIVTEDTLVEVSGKLYHIVDGKWQQGETKLYKYDGAWYYLVNGVVNKSNKLVKFSGKWYHVKDGTWQQGENGLAKFDGKWYAIKNGIVTMEDTLIEFSGKQYHVKSGYWQEGETRLYKYDGKFYYLVNGVVNKSNKLVKFDNKWYHVKDGTWQQGEHTLFKYSGKWYYLYNGIMNTTEKLFKYSGKWYHVKGGTWQQGENGLVKLSGKWYALSNGVVNMNDTLFSFSGKLYHIKSGYWQQGEASKLYKYNNEWYYLVNGVVNTAKTLFATGGKLYYVTGGKWTRINTSIVVGGKTYRVVNGYGIA